MKKLFLFTALIFVGMALRAQDIFFPTKEGTVLVYKTFDKKDKEISMVRYTITHINIWLRHGHNIPGRVD